MVVLGITLGDATGIGPEVAAGAAVTPEFAGAALVFLGDPGVLQRAAALRGIRLPIATWPGRGAAKPGLWSLACGAALPRGLQRGAAVASRAALDWIAEGARRCLEGDLDGLVTAPVNKEAVLRAGISFVGQTEYLAGRTGARETAMMLLGTDDRGRWLRVVLATTHLPLCQVPGAVTIESVDRAIRLASAACHRLGLPRQRIAVCGLNPHAGEGGLMGTEEHLVVKPALARARAAGCDADGPWPADTVFGHAIRGGCEVVVALYHDQGLAPLKLVAFDTGVNWTLGLPFVRTSPDHGTAYDIAGLGSARPDSMTSAIRLALQLAGGDRRQETRCPGSPNRHSAAGGT
ncbi:MAG: 4-hydroxythreonine-4-phosphate dehydrogenase PdxA [Verrucomicrobiae bacterium]|nr:4-hydroxythreonine-4-phosphate dehydrogenase PdxA [Verrucomicrobiae bacterium]